MVLVARRIIKPHLFLQHLYILLNFLCLPLCVLVKASSSLTFMIRKPKMAYSIRCFYLAYCICVCIHTKSISEEVLLWDPNLRRQLWRRSNVFDDHELFVLLLIGINLTDSQAPHLQMVANSLFSDILIISKCRLCPDDDI
eukprot:26357_1